MLWFEIYGIVSLASALVLLVMAEGAPLVDENERPIP
jgi:hypothetical protein